MRENKREMKKKVIGILQETTRVKAGESNGNKKAREREKQRGGETERICVCNRIREK